MSIRCNHITTIPTSTTSTSNGSIQSVPLISDDVEHLTIEIRQALENMLGKDTEIWRLLARELGYDEKHIVQFETKKQKIKCEEKYQRLIIMKKEIKELVDKFENNNIENQLFNKSPSPIIELNTEIGPQPQSLTQNPIVPSQENMETPSMIRPAIMYGYQIWGDKLIVKTKNKLNSIQHHILLKSIYAYPTVSCNIIQDKAIRKIVMALRKKHSINNYFNHVNDNFKRIMMMNIHFDFGHHTKLLPPPPPPPPPYNANNNILTSSIQTCPQHQYSYNIPTWLSSQTTDISPYQSPLPHYHHHNSVMPLFSALNQKESTQRKFHNHNNNNNRSTPLTTTNHYGQKTYNELLIGSNSPTSTTSTSNGSIQSVPLISDDVEHLTIEIRQALENMLGIDTEIWRLLARELGYDEKHIVQFESKATTITNGLKMIDTFKAIRLLLLDWSSQMTTSPDDHHQQQQQSTETEIAGPPSLATLSNALIRIGRVDCARVVVRQNYHQQQRQRQQQQNHTSTSRQ
ncbi:hypothetical protein DERF_008979 [Dermatophagoides farinae]|uniref:Death domain-containing protein n=1 Tax=Dermatophagoides farinae TaxID=6954 RepID=A0A922L3K1_DERFA|nr:hypothetical protein DERF_008979 [Dermatophagoides farinae]